MKRTSIKDVAKKAGVSITTVSRALNGYDDVSDKTRLLIQQIAEELNYAPDVNARSLGGMAETTIALLVSDLQPKDESGLAFGIISGLYKACTEYGYEFILLATNAMNQEKITYLQLCRKKNIDGIVVMGLRLDDPYYEEVLKSEIPCALIDIEADNNKTCDISIDNIAAAEEAVDYLIESGHRHIAMINGAASAAVSKQRVKGYINALRKHELACQSAYLEHCDFKEEMAYEKTTVLLKQHSEITALFCASDLMAIGAIKAIQEMGKKVPEDISVVGFDDIPVAAYVYGGLTTVRQNPYEMGRMAGGAVHKMLTKEKGAGKIVAPWEFVIRNTVRKI